MIKEKYIVEGMTCAACSAHVDKAVNSLDGIISCTVNLLSNNMEVEYDEAKCSSSDIIMSVTKAGYKAYLPNAKKEISVEKDHKLTKLISAFIILIILMYVSMGHMVKLPLPNFLDNPINFAFTQFILTLPILYIYRNYFISGYKKLWKRNPNMDSLISLGATASVLYGVIAIYMMGYGLATNNQDLVARYHHNLYFESAGMILTLVSLGKYFESLSKKKTTNAIGHLMDLAPKMATIIKDEKEKLVNVNDVNVGDTLICKRGEIIPVDGVIVDGAASIGEANITGESIPVYKRVNDEVFSATTIETGYIKIKATKVKEDTSIATIIRLVEEASNSKAPISKLADKVSGIFVPIIMSIAIITFILNLLFNRGFELAFNFGISVLVIACPCALGLATPVAIMVGTGKGAEAGLIIKNAEILEKAHLIKTVVFDKTGTITVGKPEVNETIFYEDKALEIAYSLEAMSEHPLALSVINYAMDKGVKKGNVSNYEFLDGLGLKGEINGVTYYIGNTRLANELGINLDSEMKLINKLSSNGNTVLLVCEKERILGVFGIKDKVKETSKEAISLLKKQGVNVVMLTGDNKLTAEVIASEVGVNEVIAEVLPTDKNDVINSLKKDDKNLVAMVGDAVNDALALTTADLGIAIGAGSDIAIDSSDIVLLRNDLLDVLNVINLSKRVLNTIKGNLFWAFFYNCIGVILATGLLYPTIKLNPMVGSLAMSFSSVFVVLNALSINLFKIKREKKEEVKMNSITIGVGGMMCKHCKAHVEEACKKVSNVIDAVASLEDKNVTVTYQGEINVEAIKESIKQAGYDLL